MTRAVTESEFKEWLTHPVTVAVKEILEKKREDLRQAWEGGSFSDYTIEGNVLTNVGNLGTCKGYAFVSELDFEGYTTEIEDEERVGAGTAGRSGPGQSV